MAHEISSHDGIVLHQQKAWHGLGTIVQNAPTPGEALAIAGLDWSVEQWPVSATNGQLRLAIKDQVMNVRMGDSPIPLGIVTSNYQPVQNVELADFCSLLAEEGDMVRIETAGSIRSGAKVWFLLKGESFSVRKKDEVAPYILVSNGHDGKTSLRCTPTTVRVVCSNTLHQVIPQNEGRSSKLKVAGYVANHIGDVKAKVQAAQEALGLYGKSLSHTREVIDALAAKTLTKDSVQQFFLECYIRDFGAIPANPKTAHEEKARTQAVLAHKQMFVRFDAERKLAGATAWNAFNAYTGYLQNDRTFWKSEEKEADRRLYSKLFGQDVERAHLTLQSALSV